MAPKPLLIHPLTLDFGEVQIGGIATHQFFITNTNLAAVTFRMTAQASSNGADFNVMDLTNSTLGPLEKRKVTVAFCPTGMGRRQHAIRLQIAESTKLILDEEISFSGQGTPAIRHSFRGVALPPREGEKKGFHYVCAVSNTAYLQCLERQMGQPFDWYAAVPSGTSHGKISEGTKLKPGEIFLRPEMTSLEGISILYGFDVQSIHHHWLTRVHSTITDRQVLDELDEAMNHTTGVCHQDRSRCRHQLGQRVSSSSPKGHPETLIPGDVLRFSDRFGDYLGIMVSPPSFTKFYKDCFGKRMALVVYADMAMAEDKTAPFGVRTAHVGDLGELWVRCYTATIKKLDERLPYYRVKPSGWRLGEKDIEAIRERVRLYLGIDA